MIKVNMFSSAEKVKGQGVATAYRQVVNLTQTHLNRSVSMTINKWRKSDITIYHTIDPLFYLSSFIKIRRGTRVGYVHFLPETVKDSLRMPPMCFMIFSKYMIRFYKQMDALIVVNPAFIPMLCRYGIARKKIHYMPNFVSKKDFYPPADQAQKERLRRRCQLPGDRFIVFAAGQVQYRKGVLDFIETAKQLPDVQFVWAGGFSFGKMTAGYEELKQIREQPPANVRFTGIIDQEKMRDYYQAADLFFLPSYNELFPMTILEAMNCELPVLLRDLPIYPPILKDSYRSGKSVADFIAAIGKMIDDPRYYQQAKQDAVSGAQEYDEQRMVNLWNYLYTELDGSKSR